MVHLITHCQAAQLIERAHIAVHYTLTERESPITNVEWIN